MTVHRDRPETPCTSCSGKQRGRFPLRRRALARRGKCNRRISALRRLVDRNKRINERLILEYCMHGPRAVIYADTKGNLGLNFSDISKCESGLANGTNTSLSRSGTKSRRNRSDRSDKIQTSLKISITLLIPTRYVLWRDSFARPWSAR